VFIIIVYFVMTQSGNFCIYPCILTFFVLCNNHLILDIIVYLFPLSLLQDIQHGQVMIDGIFASLKKSLNGLTKPVSLYILMHLLTK
jgi:hypothetical protein